MNREDCPVKVGDKVYFEKRNGFRGYRVNGPYTVVRIKLRPRVVVLQRSGASREPESPWTSVYPWTDEVAARQRRERAADALDTLWWELREGPRKDATVEEIEAAVKALQALKVQP